MQNVTQQSPVSFLSILQGLHTTLARCQHMLGNDASLHDIQSALPTLSQAIYDAHAEMETSLTDVSPQEYYQARLAYRASLTDFLKQADIMNRCIQLPRGYHGDYLTMEMMFRNGYEGASPLGRCLHHHITSDRSCSSVRARRQYLKGRLANAARSGVRKVLSLACGSAAELADVMTEPGVELTRIVILDQDKEALDFARERIQPLLPETCELVTLNLPVQQLLFRSDLKDFLRRPDYIYSAGLFDYLPDSFGARLLVRLCDILPPYGCLEFGNFAEWPISFFANMASGWSLILRNEAEMRALVPASRHCEFRQVEDQLFATIKA